MFNDSSATAKFPLFTTAAKNAQATGLLSLLLGHFEASGGALPTYKPQVPISVEGQVKILIDARKHFSRRW
jgi:hypothetical protein